MSTEQNAPHCTVKCLEIASLESWAGMEVGLGRVEGFWGFPVQHSTVQFSRLPAGSREAALRRRLRLSALLALESPLFTEDFPPPRPQLSHAKRHQLRRPVATPGTMLSAGGAAASLVLLMLLPLLCCCHLCHSLRKFEGFSFLLVPLFFEWPFQQ